MARVERRDYGVKIAMPGFDAQTAPDNKLLFNSSFPILQAKILAPLGIDARQPLPGGLHTANYGGEFLEARNTGFSTIYYFRWRHNLGFVPFVMALNPTFYDQPGTWTADREYIYYKNAIPPYYNGTDGSRSDLNMVFVSPTPIAEEVEYPYTASPLSFDYGTPLRDYGIKTSRYGAIKKGETSDFNDVGVDVRLQSQMVLGIKNNKDFGNKAGLITYWLPSTLAMTDVSPWAFQEYTETIAGKQVSAYGLVTNAGNTPRVQMSEAEKAFKFTYDTQNPNANRSLVIIRSPMVSPSSATIYI